jgi:predicted ATPase
LAAVLGGEFDFNLLQKASQQSEGNLLSVLDRLIDSALIFEPRRSGQREFMIVHDQYTEVAYDALPKVRRKQLHLQAAQAIEALYADNLAPYLPSLAAHFNKAEINDKECLYATLAGEQAATHFENLTAIQYLNRALELTAPDEIDLRVRLLLTREKIYDLLGDRPNQKNDLDALREKKDRLKDARQAEIVWRTAAYEWVTGEGETASTLLDAAIEQAHACGAVEIETASRLLKSRCVTHDLALSHQYLRTALALAEENGLRVIQGDIVRNIGNIYFWENNYARSQANFEAALIIHREVGDLRGELSALNNLGHLSLLTGDPLKGQAYFRQGLEICQKIGDRLAEGVLLTNLGNLLVQFGEYTSAETQLRKAYEIREAVNNEEGVGSLLPTLGEVLRRQ